MVGTSGHLLCIKKLNISIAKRSFIINPTITTNLEMSGITWFQLRKKPNATQSIDIQTISTRTMGTRTISTRTMCTRTISTRTISTRTIDTQTIGTRGKYTRNERIAIKNFLDTINWRTSRIGINETVLAIHKTGLSVQRPKALGIAGQNKSYDVQRLVCLSREYANMIRTLSDDFMAFSQSDSHDLTIARHSVRSFHLQNLAHLGVENRHPVYNQAHDKIHNQQKVGEPCKHMNDYIMSIYE
jgi:hypothetical protein